MFISMNTHTRKKRKNPHAVALSRRGASKGGKARAAKLTPEQRSLVAQKAARARWAKIPKKETV